MRIAYTQLVRYGAIMCAGPGPPERPAVSADTIEAARDSGSTGQGLHAHSHPGPHNVERRGLSAAYKLSNEIRPQIGFRIALISGLIL